MFIFARNDELNTSSKYELGRIMRYVEQHSSSLNGDRTTPADLNQLNVNHFALSDFVFQLVVNRITRSCHTIRFIELICTALVF